MSSKTPAQVRQLILQRRARFVSVALAGVGLAWGTKGCSPCLSVAPPPEHPQVAVDPVDGGAEPSDGAAAEPMVCLEAPPEPPPEPCLEPAICLSLVDPAQPCLSIAPPPSRPCLSPPAPPPEACLKMLVDPKDES